MLPETQLDNTIYSYDVITCRSGLHWLSLLQTAEDNYSGKPGKMDRM